MRASAERECERAHASASLPTRELKLASAKLENTREYSQTNTRVLTIALASTRNRTRQYLRVLAIELPSTRNHSHGKQFLWVCHAIVLISSGARAGRRFEESLYQETRCHDYTSTSICLPPSFFTNEMSEKKRK